MSLYSFLENIVIFQIVFDLTDLIFGGCLCFGALKWHKGLITYTAIGWGALLGTFAGFWLDKDFETLLICIAVGVVLFPVLAYTIPAINRFILGFIVFTKLGYMLTTILAKGNQMRLETALGFPLVLGFIIGLAFAAWRRASVGPFAVTCAFLGASTVAPTIAKYINQFIYGITGNISFLFDPIDFIFALFKIELTDTTTFVLMLVLLVLGTLHHLSKIRSQGYSLDTPLIVYETTDPAKHGKIYPAKK